MPRILTIICLLLLVGCGGPAEVAAQEPTTPAAKAPAGPVSRIVFIGQEQACDCTTTRIADVTTALTAALGDRKLDITTLYADHDSDREAVEMHREMRAFVVAPALFFFDAEGRLLEMTQGEVSQVDLEEILAR